VGNLATLVGNLSLGGDTIGEGLFPQEGMEVANLPIDRWLSMGVEVILRGSLPIIDVRRRLVIPRARRAFAEQPFHH